MSDFLCDARVDFTDSVLPPDAPLRKALERMTVSNVSIVLIVDETRHLLGVVVDGDIRRALIGNSDLAQPVSSIMTRRPRTAPFDIEEGDLRALADGALSTWLPLIDSDNVLRGLVDLVRLRHARRRLPNAAVLMAGGRGERLLPHTASLPKPMMDVGGRPILETQIRILHGHGFERVYLSVNYLAKRIESYFGDGNWLGVSIEYLREMAPLGTAGCLAPLHGKETAPILVMNGDVLTRFNPRAMMAFHEQEKAIASLAIRDYPIAIPFGVVDVDGTRLAGIREKPVHTVPINAGIYVLSPEILRFIPPGERYDMPDLLTAANESMPGRVVCFPITDYWVDIGREEDLLQARADFDNHF